MKELFQIKIKLFIFIKKIRQVKTNSYFGKNYLEFFFLQQQSQTVRSIEKGKKYHTKVKVNETTASKRKKLQKIQRFVRKVILLREHRFCAKKKL